MNKTILKVLTLGRAHPIKTMMAFFLIPVWVAVWSYQLGGWSWGPTVQHGQLISMQEQSLSRELTAHTSDRQVQCSLSSFTGQWVLANVRYRCDDACFRESLSMRQLRISLGKNQQRLSRVLVLLGGYRDDPVVSRLPPGMMVLYADLEAKEKWSSVQNQWLLIDPRGNLVLKYSPESSLKGIRQDLQRLFSASQIG